MSGGSDYPHKITKKKKSNKSDEAEYKRTSIMHQKYGVVSTAFKNAIKNLGKPDDILPSKRMSLDIYNKFEEDEKEYYGRLAFENKQNCLSKIELDKKVKNRGQMFDEFSVVLKNLMAKKAPTHTSYGELSTAQQYTKEYTLYDGDAKIKKNHFSKKAQKEEFADDVTTYNKAISNLLEVVTKKDGLFAANEISRSIFFEMLREFAVFGRDYHSFSFLSKGLNEVFPSWKKYRDNMDDELAHKRREIEKQIVAIQSKEFDIRDQMSRMTGLSPEKLESMTEDACRTFVEQIDDLEKERYKHMTKEQKREDKAAKAAAREARKAKKAGNDGAFQSPNLRPKSGKKSTGKRKQYMRSESQTADDDENEDEGEGSVMLTSPSSSSSSKKKSKTNGTSSAKIGETNQHGIVVHAGMLNQTAFYKFWDRYREQTGDDTSWYTVLNDTLLYQEDGKNIIIQLTDTIKEEMDDEEIPY